MVLLAVPLSAALALLLLLLDEALPALEPDRFAALEPVDPEL